MFYQLVLYILLFLISQTDLICQTSQGMTTKWISVKGMSSEQIKNILVSEMKKIDIYGEDKIENAIAKIELENEERSVNFINKKIELRSSLNDAVDIRSESITDVNDIKDNISAVRTELINYQQKTDDADSSIFNSQNLIIGEKNRILDELSKIPFYEVIIGRVKNISAGKTTTSYDDAIATKISKLAIQSQLGIEITKTTIVKDGVLDNEKIISLIKGKANTNLSKYDDQRISETGKLNFDIYRFGLVAVYPFQDDIESLKVSLQSKIKVEVEIVKSAGSGLSEVLALADDNTSFKNLKSMINQKNTKNSVSKSQIARLSKSAKRVISREKRKIKKSQNIIDEFKENINSESLYLVDLEKELENLIDVQKKAIDQFNFVNNSYKNHIVNEEYIKTIWNTGLKTGSESMDTKFSEIAFETFEEFTSTVKTEYLKDESTLYNNSLTELKESKKSDVILNSIKIIGKFSQKARGKLSLSTNVAYNFGFEFEESNSSNDLGEDRSSNAVSYSNYNLSVTSTPPGALVKSGRKKLGKTPLNIYVEPGLHSLVLSLNGYDKGLDAVEVGSSGVKYSSFILNPSASNKSINKLTLVGGGIAVLGGIIYYVSQKEDETGSVLINIEIP